MHKELSLAEQEAANHVVNIMSKTEPIAISITGNFAHTRTKVVTRVY